MKRRIILAAGLVSFSFLLFGIIGIARGQGFQTGQTVDVPKGKTIDSSFYTAGRTLDIAGTINGDLFCAGQNVTVSGTVHGDVICAGQNVRISAVVDGDVRAAGQNVAISGRVGHSVSAAGQSVTFESTSKIGVDGSASSGDILANGSIGRDALLNGRTVNVGGSVGRDIRANDSELTLGANAKVGGKIDYTSTNEVNINPGAKVNGKIARSQPSAHGRRFGTPFASSFIWALYMFLSLLLLSIVLALLFPRAFHSTSEQGLKRPWRSVLTGVIAFFAAPVLFVALMITVVGIPLALLFGLTWLLTLLLSGPVFAYFIGRLVLTQSKLPVLTMAVGAAIVLALYLVPLVGFILMLIALIMGSGMILTETFGRIPKPTHPLK